MKNTVQGLEPHAVEPRLLIAWEEPTNAWVLRIGSASIVFHVLLLVAAVWILSLPAPRRTASAIVVRREVTPLIAPPAELTQREPNRGPLNREFNLESIPARQESLRLPRPGAAAPPPAKAVQKFSPPTPSRVTPQPSLVPDLPAVDTANLRSAQAPPQGLGTSPVVTPPRINAEEKPKLAFENPGASTGKAGQRGTIPAPKAGIDEAIRQVVRGGSGAGLVLGDESDTVAGPTPGLRSPLPGRLGSSMELLSDPMGIDLRPYLLRVLSAVRRNWFAVIPESANLGQTGRVVVQFAISKDGSVPKVVFALPSGREALDRAAVAGISASNPFPPLPAEFRGSQIRVQLVFRYNLAQ